MARCEHRSANAPPLPQRPPRNTHDTYQPGACRPVSSAQLCCSLCLVRIDVSFTPSWPHTCVVHSILPAYVCCSLHRVCTCVWFTLSRLQLKENQVRDRGVYKTNERFWATRPLTEGTRLINPAMSPKTRLNRGCR